jgi:hypothetical protein
MAPTYYLITLAVMFGTPILIFGMKYFAAIQEARARALADDALTALRSDLSEIKTRLAAIEKILKAVE